MRDRDTENSRRHSKREMCIAHVLVVICLEMGGSTGGSKASFAAAAAAAATGEGAGDAAFAPAPISSKPSRCSVTAAKRTAT